MEKVSVIIPIYNAQKYLNRCLESIIKQTYSNYEVLLIDDGSLDSSPQICFQYEKKDNRFRYIRKVNGGVSSARNLGLKYASGNYIMFIDADDWVDDIYIEHLLNSCLNSSCEIVICSRIVESNDCSKTCLFDDVDEIKVESSEGFIPTANHLYGAVWGVVFKYNIVKKLRFDEGIYFGEDMVFISSAIRMSKTICRTNKPLYHYWKDKQEESLSKGKFSEKKMSNLVAYKKTEELFKCNIVAQNIIRGRYCDACAYFLIQYYNEEHFMQKYFDMTLQEYRRNYYYMFKWLDKNILYKMQDLILYLFPRFLLNIKSKKKWI